MSKFQKRNKRKGGVIKKEAERKAEFFRKLAQLSPQELEEINDTERRLSDFGKFRIKH